MTSRHHHSVTNVQKIKRIQTKSNMMEHLHHSWKISRFLLLEMKQDQKHNLVQRSQHSFFFLFKKKSSHSCTPIRRLAPYVINVMTLVCQTTTQPCNLFLIMLQWSYHQMYYSPFKKNRKTALQKRKCPKISSSSSSSSASIYISICIYTYTQSQRYTHLC